jgi:hypothetical protein
MKSRVKACATAEATRPSWQEITNFHGLGAGSMAVGWHKLISSSCLMVDVDAQALFAEQ